MTDSLTDTFRILDAAGNRTREGLRVIEDFARFGLNDPHLTSILKEHRHELASILGELPAASLLTSRDTLLDVGTTITTPAEYRRTSAIDVVTAAFKRVQEAIRSQEEYVKIIEPRLSQRLEQLRYQVYTTEKVMLRTVAGARLFEGQQVYLLATAAECPAGFERTIKEALDGGVRIVQSREKSLDDREWLGLARSLRKWTAAAGALLIINDRPDIAVLSEADGVHVGQEELSVRDARIILGTQKLVGVSTHDIEQARQGVLDGADYLGVGPMFPSKTKSFADFPGLKFASAVASEIQLPWYAIGGIDSNNLPDLMKAGVTRIAVGGAVCQSPTPGKAARDLVEKLNVAKANQ